MSILAIVIPVSVVGAYIIVSSVLFRFPTIIHKKKKNGVKASLIAHRGGAAENYENTITAFRHAIDCGMDMLELDCQLTHDKQVVVSHDNVILRTTGKDIKISETDFGDLPQMTKNLKVTFCKDTCCNSTSEDRNIPLLTEVFKEFTTIPINLDVKEGDEELIVKVLELVKKFHREDITVIANFRDAAIRKVKKMDPDISTCFTAAGILRLIFFTYSGLLPFLPLQHSFLEIPVGKIMLNTFELEQWYFRLILRLYDACLMRRCLFRHLQRRGIKVYLWVLNDEHGWRMAQILGVDGVMTDFPLELKKFTENNGTFGH